MSSRAGRMRRAAGVVVLGLAVMLLTFYVLLAAGLLGDIPGKILSAVISDELTTVRFAGLRTDLFRMTKVDTVLVTDAYGLVVRITGAEIRGGVPGYLLKGHVDEVAVEELFIGIPPRDSTDGGPVPLAEILDDIDGGIVVSTDRLLLEYGRIVDGVEILGSMYLDCSVHRNGGVELKVDSAAVFLPDFGTVSGCGHLEMERGVVSSRGFTASTRNGGCTLAGTLDGDDEFLDVFLEGEGNYFDSAVPLSVSGGFRGRVYGKLPDIRLSIAASGGEIDMAGYRASFEADSLIAGFDGISVRNLLVAVPGASVNVNGDVSFPETDWRVSARVTMQELNVSRFATGMDPVVLHGGMQLDLKGSETDIAEGRAVLELSGMETRGLDLGESRFTAVLRGKKVHLEGSAEIGAGHLGIAADCMLGESMVPESWKLAMNGTVDGSVLAVLGDDIGLPEFSSVDFEVNGTGGPYRMNAGGTVVARNLREGALSLDRVSLEGEFELTADGPEGSRPEVLSFRGTTAATCVTLGEMFVDSAFAAINLSGSWSGGMTAEVELFLDSLRTASMAFSSYSRARFERGGLFVDELVFKGPGGKSYSAVGNVRFGDTTIVEVSDLDFVHSKLKLVNDGFVRVRTTEGLVILDTLWIDPPVGVVSVSGMMDGDDFSCTAHVGKLDLASMRAVLGLSAEMSGVGDFTLSFSGKGGKVEGVLQGDIVSPTYGRFSMDSLTVGVSSTENLLFIDGIYVWHDGMRSGLRMKIRDVWTAGGLAELRDRVEWLELEINDIGDWLFYLLPLPMRTIGASVSARAEYDRSAADPFQIQASARIARLYVTILGIELPNINFYLNYPDSSTNKYNTRFTLGAGSVDTGNFSCDWRARVRGLMPMEVGDYRIRMTMNDMKMAIPGIGVVVCSGNLRSEGCGFEDRPLLSGKLVLHEGVVGIPQPVSAPGEGGSGEMPFDLSIDVVGTGDMWFRTNFADIEMAMKLRIFTLERKPTVNGTVSVVRGSITLLQRDFRITRGTVHVIQGDPPSMQLDVEASTRIRSAMTHQEYTIVVYIRGDAKNPEITLEGSGPDGSIAQEDVFTLLATGLTYGEMQQMNSSAIRSEVGNVAQTMLGGLLARNIRHEVGLDTFEIDPEFLSDTTSLVLNVGKYVMPNLYVSYKDDVFSGDPGTVSAQYLFGSDFYVAGSSRTAIHGNLEPTIELHYTIRY